MDDGKGKGTKFSNNHVFMKGMNCPLCRSTAARNLKPNFSSQVSITVQIFLVSVDESIVYILDYIGYDCRVQQGERAETISRLWN